MIRDREAALFVQMAIDKVVDFSLAEPRDRNWNIKLGWLIEGYRTRLKTEALARQLLVFSGSLGTDQPKWYNERIKVAADLVEDIDRVRRPWLYDQSLIGVQAESLQEAYEKAWDIKLDTPEGQAAVAEAVEYFNSL